MASPMMPQTPTPRPPHRSIAGPVVLILMGILFLLGTMGFMDIHHLGSLFARFWPALLILWGALKLIEYEQAERYGQPVRGIGVGGVFLMLFLIVSGLIATQAARVDWKNLGEHIQLGDDEGIDEIFGGSSFDYSGELSNALPAAGNSLHVDSLHINDDHGTITVNVSEDKKVKVSWRKKVHAENQQDADRYNAKTDPSITQGDKVLTLNANTQGAGDKGVTTDLDIYVPVNTALVIASGRGAVTIAGMASNVEVDHRRGEVNINDHTGNVSLNLESGSVRMGHVKGDVTVQGRANEVAVEDVDGAVQVNGEFRETRLVRVSKTVSFRSARTEMEFSRLDGRMDLDSGDLRADSLSGPMRLKTRSKDITLEGFSGDLRLEDVNGTVAVGLYKPGNIQIDNRRGDVQVSIPPNTAIKVEARTHDGEIESEFDEIKADNKDKQSSASGSIGTNGPRLVMNCDKGTIEIRKGTVAVAAPAPPTPPAPPVAPGKSGAPAKSLRAPKRAPVESEN
ncbi:MAG TPA: DUF4097 family beta strand repeat-containing protein [Terriglobales bacterium]|nr:DUF4097 family beta strand repeat-containing protein [Terriglobales bacterium]